MKKLIVIDEDRERSLKEFCDRMADRAAALDDDEVFDVIIHQLVAFYKEQTNRKEKS